MKKLTAEWVRKAESDLRAAKSLAKLRPPVHDETCFHCQQAVEKFFKSLLQEWLLPVPKTHELDDLLDLLLPHDPTVGNLRRGLGGLTQYAVQYRYPGLHANRRKASAALRLAERARREIRTRLGLRSKP